MLQKAALRKAEDMGLDVTGAVLASEAFFPFRDSIDAAAEAGVKFVIEPGGKYYIQMKRLLKLQMNMEWLLYFSGIRHFTLIEMDSIKKIFFIEIHYSISNKFLIVRTKPLLLNWGNNPFKILPILWNIF